MQVKAADDRQPDIDALEDLSRHPDVDRLRRAEIDAEILELEAVTAARAAAVYEIETAFARSSTVMTLHDLRIEVDGRGAQFDHVILNRVGEVWLCDSRFFAEGVSVTEQGEWARWWHGRRERIASPIDQVERRARLFARVFAEGIVPAPRRFGRVTMRPELRTVVLLSNGARIAKPSRAVDGLDHVLRVDRLVAAVRGGLAEASPIRLARLMGEEDLEELAWSLAGVHRPARVDWADRFGVEAVVAEGASEEVETEPEAARTFPVAPPAAHLRSGHACASCGGPVSWSAVKFCWNQPARFGRKVYCRGCQMKVQMPFGAPAPG